jgi:hypothetical protein
MAPTYAMYGTAISDECRHGAVILHKLIMAVFQNSTIDICHGTVMADV